jgi:HTH-type transcriptional regulator/antitoxin HigA
MSVAPTLNTYADLLVRYAPRVIRDEREHRRALTKIDELMAIARPSKAQQGILDLLVETVERYEEQTLPTPELSPSELLAHLIDVREVTQAEHARATSICRSSVSDMLAGRRQISKTNAVKLADYFGVDAALFIR